MSTKKFQTNSALTGLFLLSLILGFGGCSSSNDVAPNGNQTSSTVPGMFEAAICGADCGGGGGGGGGGGTSTAPTISGVTCDITSTKLATRKPVPITLSATNTPADPQVTLDMTGQTCPASFADLPIAAFSDTSNITPKGLAYSGFTIKHTSPIVSGTCPGLVTVHVNELVTTIGASVTASLFNVNSGSAYLCSPDTTSKILVQGTKLPTQDAKGIYVVVSTGSSGPYGANNPNNVPLFVLRADKYKYLAKVGSYDWARVTLPPFDNNNSRKTTSVTLKNYPAAGQNKTFKIFKSNGQIHPDSGGLALNKFKYLNYQSLVAQIGSNRQTTSASKALTSGYGVRSLGNPNGTQADSALDLALCSGGGGGGGNPPATPQPKIRRICVTPRAMFDMGILSMKCAWDANNNNTQQMLDTLHPRPGDVLTIIGDRFNAANIGGYNAGELRCPNGSVPDAATGLCNGLPTARRRVPILAKILVQGKPIESKVDTLFAYQNGGFLTSAGQQITLGSSMASFNTKIGAQPITPANFTANTSNGSTLLTNVSSTAGLVVGEFLSSPALFPPYANSAFVTMADLPIPAGTTIVSIDTSVPSNLKVTMSNAATKTASGSTKIAVTAGLEDSTHPFSGQCLSLTGLNDTDSNAVPLGDPSRGGNGSVCQVIHAVIPKEACGCKNDDCSDNPNEHRKLVITIVNANGPKDDHGSKPVIDWSKPLDKERRSQCDNDPQYPCDLAKNARDYDPLICGAVNTPTPTPTPTATATPFNPPPATPVVLAPSVTGTSPSGNPNISVTFNEVGDDPAVPAGYPRANMPVDHYEVRWSVAVSANFPTEADFANGTLLATPPGILPTGSQTIVFNNAPASARIYFMVRAFEAQPPVSDGQSSGIGTASIGTPAALVMAPCSVVLTLQSISSGGTAIINWTNVPRDGTTDPSGTCTPAGNVLVDGMELGGGDYTSTTFTAASFATDWQCALDRYRGKTPAAGCTSDPANWMSKLSTDVGTSFTPDLSSLQGHSGTVTIQGLTSLHKYQFAAKVWGGSAYSRLSNMLPVSVPTSVKTGTGNYARLSNNPLGSLDLPIDWAYTADASYVAAATVNVGQRIQMLPFSGSAFKSILIPDMENGLTVYKPAEPMNVVANPSLAPCLTDPTTGARIECATDLLPITAGVVQHGDGMPDLLDRDRHWLRYGSGKDCDGTLPITGNPQSFQDVDTFASCNFPGIWNYKVISDVEVGRINKDLAPDVILANANSIADYDVIYINTGQDTCETDVTKSDDWAGTGRLPGSDVADGIACMHRAVKLQNQDVLPTKGMTKRVKLLTVNVPQAGPDDPADYIITLPVYVVPTTTVDVSDPNALTTVPIGFYANGCKNLTDCREDPSTGISPFTKITSGLVYDAAGIDVTNTMKCEDMAFIDIDNDNHRDIICVRNAQITSADNERIDVAYTYRPADANHTTPYYQIDGSLLQAATFQQACNSAFVSTAQIGGYAYMLVGHTNVAIPEIATGPDPACKSRLYRAAVGGGTWSEINQTVLPDSSMTCHNGLLADTKNLGRLDALLACGLPTDMALDTLSGTTGLPVAGNFRGTKIFLNGGAPGSDAFGGEDGNIFFPLSNSMAPDTNNPVNFYGADNMSSYYMPGACNAVGFGDIDGDGLGDVLFGPGAASTGGNASKNPLHFLRQQ